MNEQVEYISLHKSSQDVIGSSCMGYLDCDYDRLVMLFGEPVIPTDRYKTSAEWHVEIRHGGEFKGVVTIYDYKTHIGYCEHGVETQHTTHWHVGGKQHQLASELINFVTRPEKRGVAVKQINN